MLSPVNIAAASKLPILTLRQIRWLADAWLPRPSDRQGLHLWPRFPLTLYPGVQRVTSRSSSGDVFRRLSTPAIAFSMKSCEIA